MAYKQVIQNAGMSIPAQQALIRELDLLRAELDDLRTKYGALQTALNAGTAVGAAGYPNATMALAAAKFKAI